MGVGFTHPTHSCGHKGHGRNDPLLTRSAVRLVPGWVADQSNVCLEPEVTPQDGRKNDILFGDTNFYVSAICKCQAS